MADLPKNSDAEIRRLRALPYDEYLKSVWWKKRRYARLQVAGGKCERCAAVVGFVDVHHVHYDRQGAERDSDLEVLCRDCHRKHHFDESRRHNLGAYLMLARETLRLDRPQSIEDFTDCFRVRCQRLHLEIDHRFHDAITIVTQKELSLVSAARRQHVVTVRTSGAELPPIDKQEAIKLCRRLGLRVPFKSMPERYGAGVGVAPIRARGAARLAAARCPQCQQTGAQPSRLQLGWVWCQNCGHKWKWSA